LTDDILSTLPSQSPNCGGDVKNCMKRKSYLGFAALVLAVIGTIGWWQRRSRYWLFATLVFLVLAMGPVLQVATIDTGIPLPFALLVKLPLMSIARGSDRFLASLTTYYAVLIGLGVAWLLQRGQGQRWLAAGLSILLAAEFLILPYPTAPLTAPSFFATLGNDNSQYAILELPFTAHGHADYLRTRNQIFHHKAISGGYLARPVDDKFSASASMQDWFANNVSTPDINFTASASDIILTTLNAYQFRYVVLYKNDFARGSDLAQARSFFDRLFASAGQAQPEVYEDSDIVAYQTPARAFNTSLILIGENWYPAESTPYGIRRWLDKDSATMRLVVPPGQAARYSLHFNAAAFAKPRRLSIGLDNSQPWQQTIPTVVTTYTLQLELKAGTNYLRLAVPDGYASPRSLGLDAKDYRDLSITIGGLKLDKCCNGTAPSPNVALP
ncbi:MAG: hypothetical protein DLM69_02560, partial [Candidatus Chloroheliales bacterium]